MESHGRPVQIEFTHGKDFPSVSMDISHMTTNLAILVGTQQVWEYRDGISTIIVWEK